MFPKITKRFLWVKSLFFLLLVFPFHFVLPSADLCSQKPVMFQARKRNTTMVDRGKIQLWTKHNSYFSTFIDCLSLELCPRGDFPQVKDKQKQPSIIRVVVKRQLWHFLLSICANNFALIISLFFFLSSVIGNLELSFAICDYSTTRHKSPQKLKCTLTNHFISRHHFCRFQTHNFQYTTERMFSREATKSPEKWSFYFLVSFLLL